MNARLKSAPRTREDCDIGFLRIPTLFALTYDQGDRRDADIMHARSHRHTFFCRVCWEFSIHEACTVDHEIRMRRPFPPDSLGALLRDSLK